MPSISCIIPVYNGDRYLKKAIESVLAQTSPAMEVIVVDDGSIDSSASIAKEFGSRIRYEFQDHRGVSAARNRGVRMMKTDLVCLLDADDLFASHKLEVQGKRFQARPELEFCSGLTESFWSPDLPLHERNHQSVIDPPFPHHLSTWMFRRSLFERIGGFNETMPLSQDVDWHLRAVKAGAICETIPLVLSRKRLHSGNRTRHARDECRAAVVQSVYRNLVVPRRNLSKSADIS